MALSLSNFLVPLLMLLPNGLIPAVAAETVTFNWTVGWVRANPDGRAERPVMGINGQWPLPLLNITKGDRVIVNLKNEVRLPAATLSDVWLTSLSSATKVLAYIFTACSRMARRKWMARWESLSAMCPQDTHSS